MGICTWLVFGWIVGLIARAIFPGTQNMGFVRTSLLGIGGSFAGGLIQSLYFGGNWRIIQPSHFGGAIIGALALLLLGVLLSGSKS